MSRLTRDWTAEPVSRDQILRHTRGQGNAHFPCSADHEQDWQPYPVDPYSAICNDHTYIYVMIIHTYTYSAKNNDYSFYSKYILDTAHRILNPSKYQISMFCTTSFCFCDNILTTHCFFKHTIFVV